MCVPKFVLWMCLTLLYISCVVYLSKEVTLPTAIDIYLVIEKDKFGIKPSPYSTIVFTSFFRFLVSHFFMFILLYLLYLVHVSPDA